MNRLEERLAPLDGIAAVILWVAGVAVLQGKADQPSSDASPAQALRFFQVHTGTVLLGTLLFGLGTLFFLWFLGLIRTQLGPAEGGQRRLSSIAYAAGIAMAICLLLTPATHAAGAMNNVGLSPDAAQVYLGLNAGFYWAAGLSGAVFLLATGADLALDRRVPGLARLGEHRARDLAPDRADRLDRARLRVPAVADRGQRAALDSSEKRFPSGSRASNTLTPAIGSRIAVTSTPAASRLARAASRSSTRKVGSGASEPAWSASVQAPVRKVVQCGLSKSGSSPSVSR